MATLKGIWIESETTGRRYPICPQCGERADYNGTYDSIFCGACNVWLQTACKCGPDSGCPFIGRPETPPNLF